jgi:hypothetical protein
MQLLGQDPGRRSGGAKRRLQVGSGAAGRR